MNPTKTKQTAISGNPPSGRAAAALDRLRRASEHLAASADPDLRSVGAAIGDYLDPRRAHRSLEALLSLETEQGSRSWRFRAALDMRNDLLRRYAEATFAGYDAGPLAEALAVTVSSYAGTSWPRERRTGLPAIYRGSSRELLFEAFRVVDGRVPVSAKQLARILAPPGQKQPALLSAKSC
jgi:hypothetical protein